MLPQDYGAEVRQRKKSFRLRCTCEGFCVSNDKSKQASLQLYLLLHRFLPLLILHKIDSVQHHRVTDPLPPTLSHLSNSGEFALVYSHAKLQSILDRILHQLKQAKASRFSRFTAAIAIASAYYSRPGFVMDHFLYSMSYRHYTTR